jgi:hypothetical protein
MLEINKKDRTHNGVRPANFLVGHTGFEPVTS